MTEGRQRGGAVVRSAVLAALGVVISAAFGLSGPGTAGAASSGGYFAGYRVKTSSEFTSASVTFVVPVATCTNQDGMHGAGMTEGIYGQGNSPGGAEAFSIGVNTECATAKGPGLHYFADGGQSTVAHVKPGDRITLAMSQSGSTLKLSLTDVTTSKNYKGSVADFPDTNRLIFGMISDPELVIPTFAEAKMVNATANGETLGSLSPVSINMHTAKNELMVSAGPLKPNGTNFVSKFVSDGS
jgi:hypothetical protein